jgi:hypothetical protein
MNQDQTPTKPPAQTEAPAINSVAPGQSQAQVQAQPKPAPEAKPITVPSVEKA